MRNITIAAIIAIHILNMALFLYKVKPHPVQSLPRQEFSDENQQEDLPIEEQKEVVPEFVKVPVLKQHSEKSVYGDVMSHSQERPFGDQNGRSTNAHETAHGIHSYLRNKYTSPQKRVNGFYALDGRGVIVQEPKLRKNQIANFVPKSFREFCADRYNLYVTGQREWDDTPLYIYDEWTAYIIGAKCNVEDVQAGRYRGGWTDGVAGSLDFSMFAIATAMAVKQHDPQYWETNTQFRNYTIWALKEAQKNFEVGRTMSQFKWDKQDSLLNKFLTSSDAAAMRKFTAENLNGAWLDSKVSLSNENYTVEQRSPVGRDVTVPLRRY